MITIIEGPDGAGKTVLTQQWRAHDSRLQYHHQGPYVGDPFVASMDIIYRFRTSIARGLGLLCDRFHIGEQVYGPTYRHHDALGVAGRRMLERVLLTHGGILVLALPPFDVARTAWAKRKAKGGEMFPDESGFRQVYQRFTTVVSDLPTLTYDYTVHTAATLFAIAEANRRVNAGPGAGHWHPGAVVLIIGEQPNANRYARWGSYPFVERGGCNEWLALQLYSAGISERDLYFVNARDRRGKTLSPAFLDVLQPRAIVALGRVAERWVERHARGVAPYCAVPHPAHWKRFHFNEPWPFPFQQTRDLIAKGA